MNSYFNIIAVASWFSTVIPLVIYLSALRRVSRPIHLLAALIFVSGFCDLIGFILFQQNLSTALVINIYFIAQFCLLSYYYYETFFRDKYEIILIISMIQFFVAFFVVTYFYQTLRDEHQNLAWFISSLTIITYAVLLSRKIQREHRPIYTVGHFWINNAILFYMSASLWLFAVTSDSFMVRVGADVSQFIWSFYDVNNLIKNVLFGVGIYYASQTRVTDPALSKIVKDRISSKILVD